MTKVCFEYLKRDCRPTEIRIAVEGGMVDVAVAFGRAFQMLWNDTDPARRDLLKKTIQAIVSDDSPIWSPPDAVTIDLKELARQKEGLRNDQP